jgi:hypothetical protein
MLDMQKEKYRNIILKLAGQTNASDFDAMEGVYATARQANEAFLARNAGSLKQSQADSLRRVLEEAIDDFRFEAAVGQDGGDKGYPKRFEPPEPGSAAPRPPGRWRRWLAVIVVLALVMAVAVIYLFRTGPYLPIASIDFREKTGVPVSAERLTAWATPWPWQDLPLLVALDDRQSRTNAVSKDGNRYTISGADPQLVYNLSGLALAGRDAPYLGFDFSCIGYSGQPRIEIFWWGDDQPGPEPQPRASFAASEGRFMVPLGASDSWMALAALRGIRIDLEPGIGCKMIEVRNVGLYGTTK